jgi:adenylyltransferase/sulfurtransferase
VLGVLPGLIGSAQAMEAIKLIIGIGQPLVGRLALFDGLSFQWREVRVRRNPDCPACGDAPSITSLIDYDEFCGVPKMADETDDEGILELTPTELKTRLDRGDSLVLVDVRQPHEWLIGNLGAYGAKLIPLAELPERMEELDPTLETVVYCRSGRRSADAVAQLNAAGFRKAWNLAGGTLAWSSEVDPDMPKY